MALRPLLQLIEEEPAAKRLIADGGEAFVSTSLRPYVIAALADAPRPVLVVVGDDRAARDLAADLRAWLSPRPVRWYPCRGVAYESHLKPPPHLVGLRVAALDVLLAAAEGPGGRRSARGGGAADRSVSAAKVEPPVVVVSAAALSEKVPDPELRPGPSR